MKVRWLDLAVDDLADIADYIARDNPTAAKRIVSRLWSAVKALAGQPEMGRPGRVYGTRELIVSNTPFIVPYRIVKSEIQILRVLHGARNWPGDQRDVSNYLTNLKEDLGNDPRMMEW